MLGTNRFQIHRENVIEARAPFHFVARAAVCAVQLEVALLHACNEPAFRRRGGKGRNQMELQQGPQTLQLTVWAGHETRLWVADQ